MEFLLKQELSILHLPRADAHLLKILGPVIEQRDVEALAVVGQDAHVRQLRGLELQVILNQLQQQLFRFLRCVGNDRHDVDPRVDIVVRLQRSNGLVWVLAEVDLGHQLLQIIYIVVAIDDADGVVIDKALCRIDVAVDVPVVAASVGVGHTRLMNDGVVYAGATGLEVQTDTEFSAAQLVVEDGRGRGRVTDGGMGEGIVGKDLTDNLAGLTLWPFLNQLGPVFQLHGYWCRLSAHEFFHSGEDLLHVGAALDGISILGQHGRHVVKLLYGVHHVVGQAVTQHRLHFEDVLVQLACGVHTLEGVHDDACGLLKLHHGVEGFEERVLLSQIKPRILHLDADDLVL